MALGFFSADPNQALTDPDAIAARRKLLQSIWKESLSTAPVQHWSQGAARVANALANRVEEGRLNEVDKAGNAELAKIMSGILGGTPAAATASPAAAAPAVAPAPASPTAGATTIAAPSADPYDAIGKTQGADPRTVFANMLKQESNNRQFGPDGKPLTSSAGAIGIAQVMPGTAPIAAKMAGLPFDPMKYRNDPEYNKTLGQAYYNAQVQKFGDPFAAAAAYNAGPGRVDSAIKKQDATGRPYSDFLPAETANYMAKVGAGGQPVAAPQPQGAAVAPAAAPAGVPNRNAIISALLSNPAAMKRAQKNPLLMAFIAKQLGQDPAKTALQMQILRNQSVTSSPDFVMKKMAANRSAMGQFGVTPVYGQTPDGNLAIGQLNKQGGIKWVDTQGNKIAQPVKTIDLGTSVRTIGTKTGQAIGSDIKKDIRGAKREAGIGKAEGAAAATSTGDYAKATDAITQIDALLKDKGLENVTGPVMGRLPNVSGDAQRAQARIDQIKGQTFLQAYQQLRGGGQITEVEGKKAEAAIARLNQAQSTTDFKQALTELRDIIAAGRARLPGVNAGPSGRQPAAPQSTNLKKKYGLE